MSIKELEEWVTLQCNKLSESSGHWWLEDYEIHFNEGKLAAFEEILEKLKEGKAA